MQIVVVEDNAVLAKSIQRVLESARYRVTVCSRGDDAYTYIKKHSNDIDGVILDILLPGMDGFSILKNLRDEGITVPVLILTSKDTTTDVVTGLRGGADDYLKKPFQFEELIARLQSIMRRAPTPIAEIVELNPDIRVDLQRRLVFVREREVKLTPKEFAILEHLIRNAHTVVSQQNLYDAAFDFAEVQLSNAIEVHIKNLRKKLHTKYETPIVTVRGAGYRLDVR